MTKCTRVRTWGGVLAAGVLAAPHSASAAALSLVRTCRTSARPAARARALLRAHAAAPMTLSAGVPIL